MNDGDVYDFTTFRETMKGKEGHKENTYFDRLALLISQAISTAAAAYSRINLTIKYLGTLGTQASRWECGGSLEGCSASVHHQKHNPASQRQVTLVMHDSVLRFRSQSQVVSRIEALQQQESRAQRRTLFRAQSP